MTDDDLHRRLAKGGLMTQAEAAAALGVSERAVQDYVYAGKLDGASRVGVLVSAAAVRRYLKHRDPRGRKPATPRD